MSGNVDVFQWFQTLHGHGQYSTNNGYKASAFDTSCCCKVLYLERKHGRGVQSEALPLGVSVILGAKDNRQYGAKNTGLR